MVDLTRRMLFGIYVSLGITLAGYKNNIIVFQAHLKAIKFFTSSVGKSCYFLRYQHAVFKYWVMCKSDFA